MAAFVSHIRITLVPCPKGTFSLLFKIATDFIMKQLKIGTKVHLTCGSYPPLPLIPPLVPRHVGYPHRGSLFRLTSSRTIWCLKIKPFS